MNDVIISVEHLSKRYRLGQIGATTLRESAERLWHRFRGRDPDEHMGVVGRAEGGNLKPEIRKTENDRGSSVSESETQVSGFIPHPSTSDLWALRDVSFEVKRGEVLGIIGRNGAGKSTLLKILSRITEPTSGRAVMRGRVGSLLEVGTGFHPELTGRENIFLNGAILGMKKKEIIAKFDEIVAFAEIERFLDTPVKRYSSGMYVRLAFAVAAHLDPEILLVDEVLAVGDAAFQKKCLGKMSEVAQAGRTVLFVSHNMAAVLSLCERGVLVDAGQIIADDAVEVVVNRYMARALEKTGRLIADRDDRGGNGDVRITDFSIVNGDGESLIRCTDSLRIHIGYKTKVLSKTLEFKVGIYDQFNRPVFFLNSSDSEGGLGEISKEGNATCETGPINLTPGPCSVNVAAVLNSNLADHVIAACQFDVRPDDFHGTGRYPPRQNAICLLNHKWRVTNDSRPDSA